MYGFPVAHVPGRGQQQKSQPSAWLRLRLGLRSAFSSKRDATIRQRPFQLFCKRRNEELASVINQTDTAVDTELDNITEFSSDDNPQKEREECLEESNQEDRIRDENRGDFPEESKSKQTKRQKFSDMNNSEASHSGSQLALMPLLSRAIDTVLKNRQRVGHLSLKALQFSILWFLLKSTWNAFNEVVEDLHQETSLSGDSLFCSSSDALRLLHIMDQLNERPDFAAQIIQNSYLQRQVLQLAQDLHAAGLPLRSSIPGRSSIETLFQGLTRTEASILQQCLWRPPPNVRKRPGELWDSVVGLDEVKRSLLLTLASVFSQVDERGSHNRRKSLLHRTQEAYASLLQTSEQSASTNQHIGVLLYGEPGCGKSFLIQALAAKLEWPCLVVSPSVLMRKYVGETNLQVRALFNLLQNKLSPCIVVLDELDGLFRERHDDEHDSSRELKTEFLQWLSGIMTSSSSRTRFRKERVTADRDDDAHRFPFIVVGATNRPLDVDSAILRRLPQRYYVGPPDYNARCKLIKKLLQSVPLSKDFQLEVAAQKTVGYSPSDIQQLLQTAVKIGPIQTAMARDDTLQDLEQHLPRSSVSQIRDELVVPLTLHDMLRALDQVHATPLSTNYRRALQEFSASNDGMPPPQWISGHGANQNPWGVHFMNMGTIQVPDGFIYDWNQEESATEDEFTTEDDDDSVDEDDDFFDNDL